MRSRSQVLVEALSNPERLASVAGHARVQSLPTLLQRHGLLQVVAFLHAKAADHKAKTAAPDQILLDILGDAMRAVEPRATLSLVDLAKAPAAHYTYLYELAHDAAFWLARMVP